MSNDAVWYRQRKHFNPAFSSKSLEKLIPKFWNEATIFVQLCKSESIPVVESLSHFAMDCLGAAVLGTEQSTLTSPVYLQVITTVCREVI